MDSTWVCLASGPSQNAEDIELVRQWRAEDPSARKVISANCTTFDALWCDAMYAMDSAWWKEFGLKLFRAGYKGQKYCLFSKDALHYQAKSLPHKHCTQTGMACLLTAKHLGARHIILLGYDASIPYQSDAEAQDGHTVQTHHHNKYNGTRLGTCAEAAQLWPSQYVRLAPSIVSTTTVVNCSRSTKIEVFPKDLLENQLK